MIEYLRADDSSLNITYTVNAYADNVYFEAYDLDTKEFLQSGAATASAASATFIATLNKDTTAYDRNIKIEFVSTNQGSATAEIKQYSLVRPYATISRIKELIDVPAGISDEKLKVLERRARLSLNSFIGYSFYKEKRDLTVYGNNTDVLTLPENLLEINEIHEDDILVYKKDSVTYQFDYPIEVADSGKRIKIVNQDPEGKEIAEFPIFSVFTFRNTFKKDCAYKISGIFGWEYIPADIEEASALLVNDYLCNDFNIRNKNISQLSNDSYDIKYGADSATGTGNLLVDNLIAHYKESRYLVI
jgi:hypothetical protein